MSIASKVFAEGQLPNTKTTLYTFAAGGVGIVITLYNTSASAVTANLYFKPGSTSRQLCTVSLDASGGSAVYTLRAAESGDIIEGDAGTANVIDYTITGGNGA